MSDQSYFQEMAKAGSGKPEGKRERLRGIGMSERGVYEELVKAGIPKIDAGIITDCLNMEKACIWQNDEDVSFDAVAKVNEFVTGKGLGMKVEASAGRYGKVVWEVRKD